MSVAIPPETQRNQRLASDPDGSAWVSANAGSGKTFVLTRRVVRLLLRGVEPGRILCLTFTKAAAANMAVKIFDTLARWVTLDDAELAAEIAETGAPRPDAAGLAAARRLFARTVETPGGLKILTIHAFCEKVLHLFPFEANVAAGFAVVEDRRQAELLGRARETVLAQAVAAPGSPVGGALEALTRETAPQDFDLLLNEALGHREPLRDAVRRAGGLAGFGAALSAALGTTGLTVAGLEAAMVDGGLPGAEWDAVARQLLHVSPKSVAGAALREAAAATGARRLDAYLQVFFTTTMEPRAGSWLTKPLREAEPQLCARLDDEKIRLIRLLEQRRAAAAQERTLALLTVALAVLDRYETLKRAGGLLDFDDLIERTRGLVTRAGSAWVLYKLDAGIDHLLVDEAQDTSPDQWAILEALTREFFAGEGAREAGRTFFAVGDEKQSIYSFQGARPAMVDAVRQDFARRATGAGLAFHSIGLLLSFRSVATVLDVVDRLFAHEGNARGLTADRAAPPPHQALKGALPGLVELWPAITPVEEAEPRDWRLPLDTPDPGSPALILARRIADRVAALTAPDAGETVAAGPAGERRAIRPGDVMILVRSRNAIFEAVIRALKDRGVPVAGADRLVLTDHIAAMDLMAAGRAALLPDDDLTLACVLKSPFCGLDDDDLIALAPARQGSLEAALRGSDAPRHRAAAQRLAIWRDRAATLTPFGFYTRLLGQDGGRRALLGRLGPEAGDVIDEFVALTLDHERDGAPSLLAFLARLETTRLSIKRDLAAASDAVRVMTVHAAKGLEAPVVFLPDTCGAPNGRQDAKLFRLDEGDGPALLAWSPRTGEDPEAVATRRAAEREAALDEHRRLLYVALTRAEERLYIGAAPGKKPPAVASWYDMLMAADLGLNPVPAPWDARDTILRRADPQPHARGVRAASPAAPPPTLPAWLGRAAPAEAPAPPPLRPSNALGAADNPDRLDASEPAPFGPRRAAALAGRLSHRLLQSLPDLPAAARLDAARRLLERHGGRLDPAVWAKLADHVVALIDDPALGPLFGPGSRAEVAIAATLRRPDGRPVAVTGQIDRLAVTPEAVLVADFKSGRPRPLAEAPPAYLTQLALYAAAVATLYPGRPVRALLVWTAGPLVLTVDDATLAAALAGALSDAPSPRRGALPRGTIPATVWTCARGVTQRRRIPHDCIGRSARSCARWSAS